jgi:multiple sugar transport system substrate-binding protein
MTDSNHPLSRAIDRRDFIAGAAGLAAVGFASRALAQTSLAGIDASKWTPEYITSIAGTATYDTAAECAKVVPLNYAGRLTYWYVGPNQASPQIEHEIDAQF